ncbi:hypothetical protein HYQ45_009627 [Verticillium longisporum]|uniref:Nephrocystin 3-like N-terminal domain-containing protein n=1 Tax=Verticillium longisporum TaxID=100787 RepID=A0A8I3AN34_VERLO|nr:hypothetical protein HYQ45_009627 [Verticillium longisporum]
MTVLLGLAAKFLGIVRRGHVYRICFGLDHQLEQDDVKMSLRDTIIETYTQSLKLLFLSHKRLGEGGCMQLLRALVDPHEVENTLSGLEKLEVKLDREVQACGVQLSSAANLQQHSLLDSLKQPLRRIDEDVHKCLREIEVSKKQQVLNSISKIQVHVYHVEKNQRRAKATCEWLVEHKTFLAWENSSWSSTLWLKGEMGVGKSFLTSKVIDRYLSVIPTGMGSEHASSCSDEGFGYFYSRYIDEQIEKRRATDDIEWSQQLYNKARKTLLDKSGGMFKWTQLQWEQLLRSNHEADVLGRLDTLPNDLSAAYSEIYAALSDYDQKILRRAVCAYTLSLRTAPAGRYCGWE